MVALNIIREAYNISSSLSSIQQIHYTVDLGLPLCTSVVQTSRFSDFKSRLEQPTTIKLFSEENLTKVVIYEENDPKGINPKNTITSLEVRYSKQCFYIYQAIRTCKLAKFIQKPTMQIGLRICPNLGLFVFKN